MQRFAWQLVRYPRRIVAFVDNRRSNQWRWRLVLLRRRCGSSSA
uniref:Uncharacterized protein n=1 Tax=Setaria viridis TaxID=4556 RepID=A0A4U6V9D5_SETVI|nr:hypothetical protein SEVIR_3G151650v2 [Setaria viridis]